MRFSHSSYSSYHPYPLRTGDNKYICLARKISTLRTAQGMTQSEMAKRAGISRSYLSKLECGAGIQGTSVEVIFKIADCLGVDPGHLLQLKTRDYKVSETYILSCYARQKRKHKNLG